MTDNRTTELLDGLRHVGNLHEFAELFGFDWHDDSDWTWHDVAVKMADDFEQAIAVTLGGGTLTAERVMAIAGKHQPDYCSDTHVCFDWQGIADELNSRAERTCRSTTDDSAWCFVCSECGKSFPRSQLHLAHNHGEINFCPNCGAKVTKSDQDL